MNIGSSLTHFSPTARNLLQDEQRRVRVINSANTDAGSNPTINRSVNNNRQKVNFSVNDKERINSLQAEQSSNRNSGNSLISQYTQTESLLNRDQLQSLVGVDVFV